MANADKKAAKNEIIDKDAQYWNSSYFTFDETTKHLKYLTSSWRGAVGKLVVPVPAKNIAQVEWKIKIVQSSSRNIMFGITKNPRGVTVTGGNYSTADGFFYYANNGYRYTGGGSQQYGQAANQGDTITIILDAKKKTLSFQKNGTDLGAAYPSLTDGNYRLGIDLYTANDTVEIESQKIKYNDGVTQCLEMLTEFNESFEEVSGALIKESEKLENMDVLQLLKVESHFRNMHGEYKKFTENLQGFEGTMSKFETILAKKIKVTERDWRNWGVNDIVTWIHNYKDENQQQIFQDIAKTIGEGMQAESLTADDLPHVVNGDLLRWGVTNFGQRRKLQSAIQDLVNKKMDEENNETQG